METVEKKPRLNLAEELRKYNASEIKIKPFVNPENFNMGLEKYGQVLFEGSAHEQQLSCTELNGFDKDGARIVRYRTGLDEFAPQVQQIADPNEKAAKIKSIRETVALVERQLFGTVLDPKDKNFWELSRLAANKPEYWSTLNLIVSNEDKSLDPNDARDLLIIIAAEAGGFDDIAPNYEIATESAHPYKWYVQRRRDARLKEASLQLEKDKALSSLYELKNKEPQKLFWIAKNILPISNQYKPKDDAAIWYIDLREFINGEGIETDKKKAPGKFLEWAEADDQTRQIRAYTLEAAFLRKIVTKSDGYIYHFETDRMMGGNLAEVVQFLKDPLHQTELDMIEADIKAVWNR